jgi:hypothetical protein
MMGLAHTLLPRSGTSAVSIMIADCSRTDYQLPLSQTPVKDIALDTDLADPSILHA